MPSVPLASRAGAFGFATIASALVMTAALRATGVLNRVRPAGAVIVIASSEVQGMKDGG